MDSPETTMTLYYLLLVSGPEEKDTDGDDGDCYAFDERNRVLPLWKCSGPCRMIAGAVVESVTLMNRKSTKKRCGYYILRRDKEEALLFSADLRYVLVVRT